jgi:hypothetical protein
MTPPKGAGCDNFRVPVVKATGAPATMHTMLKLLAILAISLFLGTAALSQDQTGAQAQTEDRQEPQEQDPGAEEQEDGEADDGEPAFDESVLDDQTYEGEDDEFIPSEEVPVDEPIPFPTDI